MVCEKCCVKKDIKDKHSHGQTLSLNTNQFILSQSVKKSDSFMDNM